MTLILVMERWHPPQHREPMSTTSATPSYGKLGAQRVLAISVIACLAIGLCSCGRKPAQQSKISDTSQEAPTAPVTPTTERSTPHVEIENQSAKASPRRSRTEALIEKATLPPTSIIGWQERIDAVKRLGDERVYEAVPALIANLTRITPFMVNNFLDYQETYPATDALTKIGIRAVPQITKRFEETTSEPERLILLDTLVQINGKKWVFNYLGQVDKQRTSTASTERLGTLQAWVETR